LRAGHTIKREGVSFAYPVRDLRIKQPVKVVVES
jgi:hypothetical protein